MPIPIIVSSEKLQIENSLLQFAYFSDISSAASLAGMSLFGGKNAPNTTPKCFQTQHHHRILEVEVQALTQEGRERLKVKIPHTAFCISIKLNLMNINARCQTS